MPMRSVSGYDQRSLFFWNQPFTLNAPSRMLELNAHQGLPLTARVGCKLLYELAEPTAALLCLRVRPNGYQRLIGESLRVDGKPLAAPDYLDLHGNTLNRLVLPPGQVEIIHDAIVQIPAAPDNFDHTGPDAIPPSCLPNEAIRYTLPSRYCDVDKLLNFAWQHFSHIPAGRPQVHAIADWIHENIEYRFGSGSPELSAGDVLHRGFGVCRDFAHLMVALARAMNLPARYVVGHLPDIGYEDPGTPMDFHAYAEVYLEGGWYTIDPRYNVARIGRILVSRGLDAADCAFTTSFGRLGLHHFDVWAYQVPADTVNIGDTVDLSLRLDGTPEIVLSSPTVIAPPLLATG